MKALLTLALTIFAVSLSAQTRDSITYEQQLITVPAQGITLTSALGEIALTADDLRILLDAGYESATELFSAMNAAKGRFIKQAQARAEYEISARKRIDALAIIASEDLNSAQKVAIGDLLELPAPGKAYRKTRVVHQVPILEEQP